MIDKSKEDISNCRVTRAAVFAREAPVLPLETFPRHGALVPPVVDWLAVLALCLVSLHATVALVQEITTGLYQVNTVAPSGITTGDAAPVTITVADEPAWRDDLSTLSAGFCAITPARTLAGARVRRTVPGRYAQSNCLKCGQSRSYAYDRKVQSSSCWGGLA